MPAAISARIKAITECVCRIIGSTFFCLATQRKISAACTPDFFLFDAEHRLAYRGQLDGSRPSNSVAVDGRDLRAAMDAPPAPSDMDAASGAPVVDIADKAAVLLNGVNVTGFHNDGHTSHSDDHTVSAFIEW